LRQGTKNISRCPKRRNEQNAGEAGMQPQVLLPNQFWSRPKLPILPLYSGEFNSFWATWVIVRLTPNHKTHLTQTFVDDGVILIHPLPAGLSGVLKALCCRILVQSHPWEIGLWFASHEGGQKRPVTRSKRPLNNLTRVLLL
jgi:hypothetical protein